MPVVEHQRKRGTVVDINAMNDVEVVYKDIRTAMDKVFTPVVAPA